MLALLLELYIEMCNSTFDVQFHMRSPQVNELIHTFPIGSNSYHYLFISFLCLKFKSTHTLIILGGWNWFALRFLVEIYTPQNEILRSQYKRSTTIVYLSNGWPWHVSWDAQALLDTKSIGYLVENTASFNAMNRGYSQSGKIYHQWPSHNDLFRSVLSYYGLRKQRCISLSYKYDSRLKNMKHFKNTGVYLKGNTLA